MAIIVEEEKRGRSGFFDLVVWVVIIVVIISATYYIFFKKPELAELSVPANFENAASLAGITLDSKRIANSPKLKVLTSHVEPIVLPVGGRVNPFLGFEEAAPQPEVPKR